VVSPRTRFNIPNVHFTILIAAHDQSVAARHGGHTFHGSYKLMPIDWTMSVGNAMGVNVANFYALRTFIHRNQVLGNARVGCAPL